MSKPILAYGSIPKEAGTFTFYRGLRAGLAAAGFDLRCITVGKQHAAAWDPAFADEGCVILGENESGLKEQARCFADWCAAHPVRFVMPVNSPALRAALPHLPKDIRLIPRCADSKAFGYERALTCRERIATIVATTPRHVADLTEQYGLAADKVRLIPHGVPAGPFDALGSASNTQADRPLRLAFLGRLEHKQKGILFLPAILARLDEAAITWTLSIAGQGEHQAQLEEGLAKARAQDRTTFVGLLNPAQVPAFLASHDVLLFPSQHEGFGFALIEALLAGCVPVASKLEGVTDFIVRNGSTGLLCPVGGAAEFANAIVALAKDRPRLAEMKGAGQAEARARFTDRQMTAGYAGLLNEWMKRKAPPFEPKPWSSFSAPKDLCETAARRWLRRLKRRILPMRV